MMSPSDYRSRCIKIAGTVALAGNLILASVKVMMGLSASSLAVVGDGVDSFTDVLTAAMTLVISGVISHPSDKEHPWGHERAETMATMVLAFAIFFAGTQLMLSAVRRLISGQSEKYLSPLAVCAAVISITGKTILSLFEFRLARLSQSEIIRANAENMKSDIMLSVAVLVGTGASTLFKMPALDPVAALIVGAWVIKNAMKLFSRINMELMDGNSDNSLYQKLFKATASIEGVSNPHRARIRRMASSFDIDLDIEVAPDMTVFDAHELSEQLEAAVRREIPEVYDIVVHLEPCGSATHQPKEEYGLTPDSC